MAIIKQVYENKQTSQKLICVPKGSDIKPGDFVEIRKVEMIVKK